MSEQRHRADSHDLIRVQGAGTNNLKSVTVEIPKRRLTVFTGLHLADVENLLGLLDRLVDAGKLVIVIEHNQGSSNSVPGPATTGDG